VENYYGNKKIFQLIKEKAGKNEMWKNNFM